MTDYKEQKAIYDEVQEPMKDVNNRVSADEAFNPMTRLEKAKELRPDLKNDTLIVECMCPAFVLGKSFPGPAICGVPPMVHNCLACWNEEYKE